FALALEEQGPLARQLHPLAPHRRERLALERGEQGVEVLQGGPTVPRSARRATRPARRRSRVQWAGRGVRRAVAGGRHLLAEDQLAVGEFVDDDHVARDELTADHAPRQPVLDVALDGPLEGPCPELRIPADAGEEVLRAFGDLETQLSVFEPL